MAIRAILILGTVMLTCGSAGLLAVRLTNPLLRGLGFLGGAFASGGMSAALLLNADNVPRFLSVFVTDICILASFTLLHVAVLELLEADNLLPKFGLLLLGCQAAFDVWMLVGRGNGRERAIVAGLCVGAQALQTALLLIPRLKQRLLVPGLFVTCILAGFAVVNVFRSIAIMAGFLQDKVLFYQVAAITFALYIAAALGLAFGIFWMTTTVLTTGLEHMASTDPLTRIFNRRVFLRWCERERERNARTLAPFSILMIDIDHFKVINDNYGHQFGDEVLCTAVENMQNAIRGIDVLGRWGGEEFAALLPNASADAASLVAERVRANVSRMRLPAPAGRSQADDRTIRLTVSIGVATFSDNGDSLQQMLKRADAALYKAKATGRNRVVVGALPAHTQWLAASL